MPTPDAPSTPRRRGAPPGNANAKRHGFYARLELTEQQRALLDESDSISTDDVIDALRVELFRLVTLSDYDPRALAALAKAIFDGERTRHRLAGNEHRSAVENAIGAVLADVERARTAAHGQR